MKNLYTQKLGVFVIFCLLFLLSFPGVAQVGIGTTNPNSNALLDIDASTTAGGLLLPRVALTGTANEAPLSAHVQGMTVYNTATAGNVTPGYYYNDGTQWVRIAEATTSSNDWTTTGNAGTTSGTNFIGTTDNNALRVRTNNVNRFEFTTDGRLQSFNSGSAGQPTYSWNNDTDIGMYRIGANTLGFSALQTVVNGNPVYPGDRFTVHGATDDYAINGYATGANGVAVYGENATVGGTGIIGDAAGGSTSKSGNGVIGINRSGSGNGVYGNSSNVGVRGYGGHGAILESRLNNGYGAVAWNTTASGTDRTGLLAIGQNLNPITFPSTGAILYGRSSGGAGFADEDTGTGLLGVGNDGTTAYSLVLGSGIAGTGNKFGVYGYATETGVDNQNGDISSAGGYFGNAYDGHAYVAGWYDPEGGGNNDQNFKIIGTGNVSTIVKDVNDVPVIMYAPEAPESLFQDYGVGKLTNGTAIIQLDPTLSKNIRVDADHPIKVFVQLEGDCNGVYVTNKSATGFTVKELQNGRSNANFSWSIVATRADEVFYNDRGEARISHNNLRFPKAPKRLEVHKQNVSTVSSGAVETQIKRAASIPPKEKTRARATVENNETQAEPNNTSDTQTKAPAKTVNTKNKN